MARLQINGVIHQRQLNPRACWYTSLQMAVRYYENQARGCLANLTSPDMVPKMQRRFDAGSNPSWAEWRDWPQELGFTALNITPNEVGIINLLRQYGPIVYSGTWGWTFDGHVVVITGIDTTSGPTVYVDDPLEVRAPVAHNMNAYMSQLAQTLWENPLFVYAG